MPYGLDGRKGKQHRLNFKKQKSLLLWKYRKEILVEQNKYYSEQISKSGELEAIFKKHHYWGKEGKKDKLATR